MMINQNIAPFIRTQKAGIFINENYINNVFESIYSAVISNIQKSLESGWVIDSVTDHNISKYNPLAGSSCIKLLNQKN